MRWSDRSDDNIESLLRGEDGGKLGAALAELREHKTEPSEALRERVRLLAAEKPVEDGERRPRLARYRLSFARVGALAAAALVVAVAIPAIAAISDGGIRSQWGDEAGGAGTAGPDRASDLESSPPTAAGKVDDQSLGSATPPPQGAPPPSGATLRGSGPDLSGSAGKAVPVPSTSRAQDYSARIKLHVGNHDELSEAVQSAIRSTRQLGGYVTYVDYGTSGSKEGQAALAVRVPVGRVQTAVARFAELGTILEQRTEIVDLQARIDRSTRDIDNRRDRIAKLEAELKDPTLGDGERNRLEARLVQAKRGLANAIRGRAGVLRQSRYAKLDLAFTTEKQQEPATPPSELRKTLDDAAGILVAELGVLLFILIAGAPFIALTVLGWLGARALKRGANARVLERA